MSGETERTPANVTLRLAAPVDAAALAAIYAPYVLNTCITYEFEVPSETTFMQRIMDVQSMYPYLVAEVDGRIAGYAYAHRFREREAYDWAAETSIYLDPAYCKAGVGTRLYRALIELLEMQGVRGVIAGISLPNPPSVRLQERCGFSHVGTFHKIGYKNGQWLDMCFYYRVLNDFDPAPAPITPFPSLDADAVEDVLRRFSR